MEIDQKTHTTENGNTVIVLKPKGRLDITTAWQFRLKLQECISKLTRHVAVNLGEVDFIDSSGLTSLVAGMRDADKAKGSFCICNVHPDAKLVFEVTMMDTVFEIYETEEEALAAILPNSVNKENNSFEQLPQTTPKTTAGDR
ncbi:STAS domain-containing protein [Sphaerospermopsis aphanizomenoides BCCUSP55]|uniref:STAS domain-containing protein n=1 Tax=Sphaerospermopsis aphanizomenoides TaxID=459663 RepID=UPI00190625AB|nr:STAS domain-containing protein [Sphaerospermopsis aphanizomenoides]MBK1990016.1 STAS domain-containing protein [Sphaerospermopsis aphanizomenoides BCCUSP55]